MMGFLDNLPVNGFGSQRKKKSKPEAEITTDVVVRYSVVRCPQCGGDSCPVYSTAPHRGGHIIRYHKCRTCGCGFKSIEGKIRN